MSRFSFVWNRFRKNENGAVTVDWVVLTAGVVGLAAGVLASAHSGTVGFTESVAAYMGEWFAE